MADAVPPPDPRPALTDMADGGWEDYEVTRAMWAETWDEADLDFGPPGDPDDDWPAGYGPDGHFTAGEWLLLGERMADNWREAFDAMHAPVRDRQAA